MKMSLLALLIAAGFAFTARSLYPALFRTWCTCTSGGGCAIAQSLCCHATEDQSNTVEAQADHKRQHTLQPEILQ